MIGVDGRPRKIDASIGDVVRPFTHAAQYALEKSMQVMHQYDNDGHYAQRIATGISDYLTYDMGLQRYGYCGIGQDCVVFTNGTTGGFAMIVEQIGKEIKEYNEITKQDAKPVILMPIPTYGMFFDQPKEHGMEVVTFPREKDGSVDPAKLDALITQIHAEGKQRVVAYYDSNPNNPTGYVREAAQTSALADVFEKHNETADDERYAMREAHVGKSGLYRLAEISSRIRIIDDMVYMGTEYSGKKAAPFMLEKRLSKDIYTLLGCSKIGLVALRAGMVVCDTDLADNMRQQMKRHQYFPSIPALHALEATFSSKPEHAKPRQEHLDAMNADHRFSGQLLRALVNGIDDVRASEEEKQEMVKAVAMAKKITPGEAKDRLQRGIANIKVITDPQAGFFHLIDYSAMRGQYLSSWATPKRKAAKLAEDEWAVQFANNASGLSFCTGTNCGLSVDDMIMRTTFAMPPAKIVELADRMEYAMGWFAATEQDAEFASPNSRSAGR